MLPLGGWVGLLTQVAAAMWENGIMLAILNLDLK
jgi:hypothetical protein